MGLHKIWIQNPLNSMERCSSTYSPARSSPVAYLQLLCLNGTVSPPALIAWYEAHKVHEYNKTLFFIQTLLVKEAAGHGFELRSNATEDNFICF